MPNPVAGRLTGRLTRGLIVWIALAVRLSIFPFAENKQADAPMRALIAERMNADPVAAADPRSFYQFGPLPIEVMRPFMTVDPDLRRSSRWPSLVTGIAVFWPFFALAGRMVGANPAVIGSAVVAPAVVVAGLALALSPLHIQVSTTAASESLYLLLLLGTLERLHAAISLRRRRDYVYAGVLASLASVTRYDTWLAVPVAAVAALWFGRRDRRALVDTALFVGVAATLPLAYLAWSGLKSGDPFFFARYITHDHKLMAEAVRLRLGGGVARVRQIGIWVVSFAAAMTPLPFIAAVGAACQWRRWSAATRVVVAAALAPPAAYLVKGVVLGDFEPLPRFAIAPGAVLLPLAAQALLSFDWRAQRGRKRGSGRGRGPGLAGARVGGPPGSPRHTRVVAVAVAVAVGALAMSALALALAFPRAGRIWTGAESIGPLTRLDGEDRALAQYLQRHRRPEEGVFIDTFGYVDIVITHAARVPAPLSGTLAHTRMPAPTLAEARALTGASWFAFHDQSWGKVLPPDWPSGSPRFGQWNLAHLGVLDRGE